MKVTINSHVLRRCLAAVTLAASNDEFRPHLAAVLFRVEGPNLLVVATDGRWLAEWTEGDIAHEGGGATERLVPATDARFAMAALPQQAKRGKGATLDLDSGALDPGDGPTLVLRARTERFPPYKDALPSRTNETATPEIGVSPVLMTKVMTAFIVGGSKARHPEATLRFGTCPLDPIEAVSVHVPQLRVVLMPVRLTKPEPRRS